MTVLSAGSTWTYGDFMHGEPPHEMRLSLSNSFTIRGGWSVSVTPTVTSDEFNPADYTSYYTIRGTGATSDTVPFTTGPRTSGLQWQARVSTPQFSRFAASLSSTYGTDAEYFETARARRLDVSANLDWRPTQNLRLSGTMQHQEFRRERDRSAVLQTNIPRLRMEYQLSRAIFFRFVGQYESRALDAFRDPATDAPLLYRGSDGTFTTFDRSESNRLRADWLFSFAPSPGRVIYVGYGASLSELDAFRFRGVERTSDGLFVKLSYQYRVP
jgi:hypothetical protein